MVFRTPWGGEEIVGLYRVKTWPFLTLSNPARLGVVNIPICEFYSTPLGIIIGRQKPTVIYMSVVLDSSMDQLNYPQYWRELPPPGVLSFVDRLYNCEDSSPIISIQIYIEIMLFI